MSECGRECVWCVVSRRVWNMCRFVKLCWYIRVVRRAVLCLYNKVVVDSLHINSW